MLKQCVLLSTAVAVCLVFFMALPSKAQETQQQKQPGDAGLPPGISEAKLEKAAEAYSEVRVIHDRFQQSVQQTEDQDERKNLQIEANKKMVQAVENTGLDLDTYNNIMVQVRTNEELNEKFTEKMRKLQ